MWRSLKSSYNIKLAASILKMFETLSINSVSLPHWLDKLPPHVKGCILFLICVHALVLLGAIILGLKALKSEDGAGIKPPFSQDFKTKNQ